MKLNLQTKTIDHKIFLDYHYKSGGQMSYGALAFSRSRQELLMIMQKYQGFIAWDIEKKKEFARVRAGEMEKEKICEANVYKVIFNRQDNLAAFDCFEGLVLQPYKNRRIAIVDIIHGNVCAVYPIPGYVFLYSLDKLSYCCWNLA